MVAEIQRRRKLKVVHGVNQSLILWWAGTGQETRKMEEGEVRGEEVCTVRKTERIVCHGEHSSITTTRLVRFSMSGKS